ncbi:hypothetical protein LHYA1_G008809 [Lachnellula hyalina]|uniref:Uncharacterized protein n=1 Tax=Lachnellula hyalina TaxID=1316788 RepID=A0A8H8TV53_9HELO|nr:uncharacterized protein LHYA1_G008809 [Lachnellula hyalina]TVY22992.1 hypothetical protein LHYA1_G008809 [Lachnellula hyalina]
MFRHTRTMRGIFSMSRLPLNLEAKKQAGQAMNVQKVRFRKQAFRPKMLAFYFITSYICYDIYGRMVLDPIDKAAMEAMEGMPAEVAGEVDDPLFIPFPGTVKETRRKPYRGSDPEWQEFIKFSKDKTGQTKVRDELARRVKRIAELHPIITRKCGKELTQRRCWLDVDFPHYPPPEFERSGIEISDEAISWTTQPVDSLTVYRLRHVLWPSALALSFWNFTKVLIVDDTKRIASMLGIRSTPSAPSIEQLLQKQQQMMKGSLPNKDGPPAQAEGETTSSPKAMIKISTAAKTRLSEQPEEKTTQETEIWPGTRVAVALHQHFNHAIMAFKGKFLQTWHPTANYPPRGSILVSGMVELEAPKAYLVFDVNAAWDPQVQDFDARSMVVKLRRFQWKSQGPVVSRQI